MSANNAATPMELDVRIYPYYALEVTAPEGYKLDDTPHYFEVKDGT